MEHEIHRFDIFLPELARRHGHLMEMIPEELRPNSYEDLSDWVLGLSQDRRLEICQVWVLETLRRMRHRSPLTNVLLRGCLFLEGEFDVADAGMLGIGTVLSPGDPRRDESRRALLEAVKDGILIHTPNNDRFCIPVPVQFSLEGFDLLDPLERDALRLRTLQNFAIIADRLFIDREDITPAHWRFSNLLLAFEIGASLLEESIGLDSDAWVEECHRIADVPENLVQPLVALGRALGRAIVRRPSESGEKFIAAAVCAAVALDDMELIAYFEEMMAQFHLRRGHYARAAGVFERIEERRQKLGDQRGVVLAITARAIAMRDAGDSETALQEFLRANRVARDAALSEEYLDTANCAAHLLLAEGHADQVLKLAEEMRWESLKPQRPMGARAEFHLLAGRAFHQLGREVEANDAFFKALGIAQSNGHRPIEAAARREIARQMILDGNTDGGWHWFEQAMRVFEEVSDAEGVCECALEMADMRSFDSPIRHEELLRRAMDAAQDSHNPQLAIAAYRRWAELKNASGEYQYALAAYQRMIAAHRFLGNHGERSRVHMLAAKANLSLDFYDEALREALCAQALLRYINEPVTEDISEMIANCSREIGPDLTEFIVDRVTQDWESGDFLATGREVD